MALESSSRSRKLEKNLNSPAPTSVAAAEVGERMDFDQSIRDPERGKRFALYIEHAKGKDKLVTALAKYQKGEHTERELLSLQSAFETFEQKEASAEHSSKTIEDWQDDILKNSEEFSRFTKFQNLDKIKRVLEKGLPDLALKDPKLFKEIQGEIEKLNAFVERDGKADKAIEEFCAAEGFTEDTGVLDALQHLTEKDRHNAVRKLLSAHVRQRDGFFGRLFAGSAIKATAKDLASRVNLGELINERKQVSKEFGDYLRVFLVKNKEFRTALSRAHDESQPTFEKGSETKLSFAEAQAEDKQLAKEATLARAKEYKRAHEKEFREAKRRFTAGDPSMLNDLQDDFYGSEENRRLKYDKLGGIFARVFIKILGVLFNAKTDPDIKKELS